MRRRIVGTFAAALAVATVGVPSALAVEPPMLTVVPTAHTFAVRANTAAATTLAYDGTATDAGVNVLVFTTPSVSLTGFTETDPCTTNADGVGSQVVRTSSAVSLTGTASAPVTLHATQLAVGAVTFTPTSPPTVGTLSVPGGTPLDVTATLVTAVGLTGDIAGVTRIC